MDESLRNVRYRVSAVSAFFMVALAAIIDLVQFLLTATVAFIPLTWLLTGLAAVTFGIWFLIVGVSYFGGKRDGLKMVASVGSVVAEFVPIINALPAVTLGVVVVIVVSRIEDRERAKEKRKKLKQERAKRMAAQREAARAFQESRAASQTPLAANDDDDMENLGEEEDEESEEYRGAA